MADEINPNGKNGNKVGVLEKVTAGVKEDIQALKTDIPAKAKEQIEGLKDPTKTQVYTSIFRHKHDDTPRNRALGVLSNVFLHLHPAKINRDAVRYSYTWGMGGITFYLFIILTYTGVLLMFYYHPSKVQAFRDVLYLEHDVPFGKILRNMHRWAAHLMVIGVWLHMFRVFLTGSYKKPREFNWNIGVLLLVFTLLLSFTGYLLPDDQLGFWAVTVGTNMARATPLLGHEGPFGPLLGMTPYNDVRFGLLGGSIVDANALLRSYIWHCIGIPIVASVLMIVHFWRVRKDGGISGPAQARLAKGSPRLALSPADRVSGRHHRHHHPDGLVDHAERAARRTRQSEPDHESGQGPLVLPRLAGNAGLFRSMDRWRGHADPHHRRINGDSIHRHQPEGQRLLHLEAAPLCDLHIPVRLHHSVGLDDHHRHLHSRARLAMVLAGANVGSQSIDLRGEP